MMKLFLINPDYMTYGDPPLGLAYIASYIRKNTNNTEIRILDQISEEKILETIKKSTPELIGFTAVSQNYYQVKELASKIKNIAPDSLLIIGGVHITASPNSFNKSPFDIAIIGEGEIPSLNLILNMQKNQSLNIKELSKIKGFILRDGENMIYTGISEQIKNLDDIPMPARDLLNMKYYTLPRFSSKEDIEPIASILTSRGCPYACKFCSSSSFWGRNVRFFSAKRVVEEISILYYQYNYRRIYIYDDLFSINKTRIKEIIRGLEESNLLGKIEFSAYGRANCFDKETAELFKKLNVKSLIFGFETGSQRLLTYLKGSGVTIENAINAIKLAKENNFEAGAFFMLGSPTETTEDYQKTYEFIKEYCPNSFIIYQTIPFPGTEVWQYALDNNLIEEDFYDIKQREFIDIDTSILLSKNVSKQDFVDYFQKIRTLYISKNKNSFLINFLRIRPRHLKSMLSREFISKANNLKKQLLKRIT